MPESQRQNPDAMASLVHIDPKNIRFRHHWSIADPKLFVLDAFIDIGRHSMPICLYICQYICRYICLYVCHLDTHFDTHFNTHLYTLTLMLLVDQKDVIYHNDHISILPSLESDKRRNLRVCRSPNYGRSTQHRSWYLFIFGLVLRERNHGAVPSRSNHDVSGVAFEGLGCSRRIDCVWVAGGHFEAWWQRRWHDDNNSFDSFLFRQRPSSPTRTFPISGICPTTPSSEQRSRSITPTVERFVSL